MDCDCQKCGYKWKKKKRKAVGPPRRCPACNTLRWFKDKPKKTSMVSILRNLKQGEYIVFPWKQDIQKNYLISSAVHNFSSLYGKKFELLSTLGGLKVTSVGDKIL